MSGPRIGSLCTGYGGLDQAVHAVFGGTTAWVSDIDPGAAQILKHRMPDVPNIGDLTTTDWAAVEPVDIVLGGYPCQPFSTAGKRKGTEDERHIWPFIARALGVLRPRIAIFENVGGHLRLGFDVVLADLASLGFDVEWCVVRASEVGAPHPRRRLFIVATAQDADREPRNQRRLTAPGQTEGWRTRTDLGRRGGVSAAHANGLVPRYDGELPAGRDALQQGVRAHAPRCGTAPAADTSRPGLEVGRVQPNRDERQATERGGGGPVADAARVGRREGRPEPARLEGRPSTSGGSAPDWGRFAPAIRRWEAATGRTAPWATDDRNRLSPRFVEWLMGLEAGWVTDVPGLSRTQQLHALGNGVVPQQAEAAIRLLAARAASHTAAAA